MANLSSGDGSGGGDDGSSYYDPRRDPEYEYTPDEQQTDDSEDSGSTSSDDDASEYEDDPRSDPDTGYVPDEQQTDETGDRPPRETRDRTEDETDAPSEYEDDPRRDPETGYVPEEQQTDETGERPPRETRQTYDDVVSEETRRESTGGTPGDAQGTGQEDVGTGYVIDGRVVDDREQAEEQAEDLFTDEYDDFTPGMIDAEVSEAGAVTFTITEAGAQQLFDDYGVTPGDEVGSGQIPTTQEAARQMEQMAIEETAATDAGDVRIVEDEGKLTAEFSYSGREKVAAEDLDVSREDIDIRDGAIVPTSGEGESALRQPAQRSSPGQNFQRLESETSATFDQGGEQFGDVAVQIPGTNRFVEETLETGSEAVQTVADTAGGLAGGGFGDFLMQPLRGEDSDVRAAVESGREDQTRAAGAFDDFVTGAISIADVPGVAVTAKEAGEYTGYAGSEVIAGNYDDLVSDTGTAGRQRVGAVADYARANPAEVAGLGAGGLFGSAAIMGTAGRISSRAGTVSRYAIQPGEEIAGSAGFRATRRIAGEDTAQRAFPNREPLIFSEEAAIRGARNVRSRIGDLEYQAASRRFDSDSPYTYTDAETRFEGDEWPAEYTPARSRLGRTRGGADGPQTVQQPERLGGAGQDVVDRMYAVEADTQPTAGGENLPGIRDRIEGQVREFAADERAQQQLIGRQRGRTETESEVQQTADRVSPNLYQQSVTRQLDAEYEARMGTIEEPDVTGRFGFESELETRRAGRTEARTETRTDRGIETEIETRVQPGFDIGQRPGSDVFTGAEFDVGQEPGFDVFADTAEMTGFDIEFDQEFETELETEQETAQEFELFREVETETETEFEFETETRRELEGVPDLEGAGGDFTPGAFEGARGDIFTGFRNPLTGEEL